MKKRNSNIELLHVIAMVLIVLNHLSYHGGAFINCIGFNHYLAYVFVCGGKFGVAIFVIIGSFFMAKKPPSFQSILSLWVKTFIVSLTFGTLDLVINGFSFIVLVKSFLPFFTATLWFVTEYIVLMLLSPFLNIFIQRVEKLHYLFLIVVLLVVCSIIPTIKLGEDIFLNELVWFIFLYLLVGFLSKHTNIGNIGNKKYILLAISVITFSLMCALLCILGPDYLFLRSSGSALVLMSSICLFFFFVNFKERNNVVINYVASATFAVYLIHDNSMRLFIWNNIFRINEWLNSSYFILFSLMVVLILFACAVGINIVLSFVSDRIIKLKPIHIVCEKMNSYMLGTNCYD